MNESYQPDADPPPASAAPAPRVPVVSDEEARQWAMFCHLAALAQFVLPTLGNIIGPLVVWLLKKQDHPFIDDQGKEAINFQISMSLYSWLLPAVSAMLICVGVGLLLLPIAIIAVLVIAVVSIILSIMAALQASSGQPYRYPMTIRFLK